MQPPPHDGSPQSQVSLHIVAPQLLEGSAESLIHLKPALASFFGPASLPPSSSGPRCRWSTFSAPSFPADTTGGLEHVLGVFLEEYCPQTEVNCFCSRSGFLSFELHCLSLVSSPSWDSTRGCCQLPGGGIKECYRAGIKCPLLTKSSPALKSKTGRG